MVEAFVTMGAGFLVPCLLLLLGRRLLDELR
jgi:hypothetical protein